MIQKFACNNRFALYSLLTAIAVAFFLLALWTPLMQDDLVFMAQSAIIPEHDNQDAVARFSWEAWRGHVEIMYLENNGRMANLLAPLGAWLIPQWLRGLLIGVCAAWIFFMASIMACDSRRDWRCVLLMWALSLVAWPWRDRLMMWDYALNYLFTSALILPFIYLYCRREFSRMLLILGAVCGFFGAWFHDGSAICLVAAVGTLALLRRFHLSAAQWVMAASIILGTIVVLASPAEWQRASSELGRNSLLENIVITSKIEPMAWILALVWLGGMIFSKKRTMEWLTDDMLLVTSFMAFYSLVMSVLLDPSGRYGWQAGLFATIALFRQWHIANVTVRLSLRKLVLSVAALGVVIVMTSAISFQHKLWIENDEIYSASATSSNGTVCRDLLTRVDEPRMALRLPTTDVWGSAFQMACANACSPKRGRMLAVVPECFFDFAVDSILPLDGDAGLGVYKGYLIGIDTITPFDDPGFISGAQRTAVRELLLSDSEGNQSLCKFWIYKFREPREGGRAAVFWGPVSEAVTCVESPR